MCIDYGVERRENDSKYIQSILSYIFRYAVPPFSARYSPLRYSTPCCNVKSKSSVYTMVQGREKEKDSR